MTDERPWTSLTSTVLGAPDARKLAEFYCGLLGYQLRTVEEHWVTIGPPGGGTRLSFQTEENHVRPVWPGRPGDQQMQLHLDIEVHDLDGRPVRRLRPLVLHKGQRNSSTCRACGVYHAPQHVDTARPSSRVARRGGRIRRQPTSPSALPSTAAGMSAEPPGASIRRCGTAVGSSARPPVRRQGEKTSPFRSGCGEVLNLC